MWCSCVSNFPNLGDSQRSKLSMIENPAERRDLDGQIVVLDHGARPDGSHDLVFRDEIAVARDEHAQHVERARADRHWNENTMFI